MVLQHRRMARRHGCVLLTLRQVALEVVRRHLEAILGKAHKEGIIRQMPRNGAWRRSLHSHQRETCAVGHPCAAAMCAIKRIAIRKDSATSIGIGDGSFAATAPVAPPAPAAQPASSTTPAATT